MKPGVIVGEANVVTEETDVDLSQPVAEREPDVKLMDKGVGKPVGY